MATPTILDACDSNKEHRHRRGGPLLDAAPLLALYPARNDSQLAEEFGVTRRQIARWRAGGRVYETLADAICCRIDRHLCELWPDQWGAA